MKGRNRAMKSERDERVVKLVRKMRRRAKRKFYTGRARTAKKLCRKARRFLKEAGIPG